MLYSGFSLLGSFSTALFGVVSALIAIVFKQRWDFHSERSRYTAVLLVECEDVAEHFRQNMKRLEAMISVLRDGDGLWPEKVHLQKLLWPHDTAFFNTEIIKFFDVHTANNIAKFRLRLRNANLDAEAALRVYDTQHTEALLTMLNYVRLRSARLRAVAPFALRQQADVQPDVPAVAIGHYRSVKDMVFLPKQALFPREANC